MGSSSQVVNVMIQDGEAKQTQRKSSVATSSSEKMVRKLPHNCDSILEKVDPPTPIGNDNLIQRLRDGVFLNNKKQKYWIDGSSNSNCFMLFPSDLTITWSENQNYWSWFPITVTPNETSVEAVELRNVCWLDISGKFDTRDLTPGTRYEVVFVVKLEDPAYGWDTPVNLKLTLPSGQTCPERKVSLREMKRYLWQDIPAGEFVTSPENAGEIKFSMYEHDSGTWKKGLSLKGVEIRPKSH